jgi:hypothetical protein
MALQSLPYEGRRTTIDHVCVRCAELNLIALLVALSSQLSELSDVAVALWRRVVGLQYECDTNGSSAGVPGAAVVYCRTVSTLSSWRMGVSPSLAFNGKAWDHEDRIFEMGSARGDTRDTETGNYYRRHRFAYMYINHVHAIETLL